MTRTTVTIYCVHFLTRNEDEERTFYFVKKTEAARCFRRAKVKKLSPWLDTLTIPLTRNSVREAAAKAAAYVDLDGTFTDDWKQILDREASRAPGEGGQINFSCSAW